VYSTTFQIKRVLFAPVFQAMYQRRKSGDHLVRHNSTGGITRQLSNGSLPMYTASPGSSSSVGSANSAYFSGTSSNGHESPFKKCRSGSPSGGIFGKVMKFFILVFIGGVSYLCYVLNQNSISLKSEVNGFSATLEEKKSLEQNYRREIAGLLELREGDKAKLKLVEEREKAYLNEDQRLREYIGKHATSDTSTIFGKGPHRVYVELEFPEDVRRIKQWKLDNKGNENNPPSDLKGPTSFIIRLYHDNMPHSTNVFLHSVKEKFYDGIYFDYAPEHILMTNIDERVVNSKFVTGGQGPLAFSEYSPKHKHEKWTIGFAGRPSGPNFYMNMVNNTLVHGPGGQERYVLNNNADPCFGKVIAGGEAITRMHEGEKTNDMLKLPVMIRSARILRPDEYKDKW